MTRAIIDRWPLIGRRASIDRFEVALADPEAGGLLIHGDAGLGKTRLADECLALAEAAGNPVGRVIATRTAAALPLGAIAHLLPEVLGARPGPASVGPTDPVQLFDRARQALTELVGEGRYVLFIDDIHLLDPTSITLVAQLLAAGLVFLICTVRSDEPVSDVVTALWRDYRVLRVDLEPLDRTSVDELLQLVLGGPVEGTAVADLWEVCEGNALFLHELVMGALDGGSLVEVDGVWRLERLDPGVDRLIEIVERRLADVEGPARELLDLLALCQPLSLTDAEDRCGAAGVESLERSGLITLSAQRRRQVVTLAHPLHAEVLRRALPRTRARRLTIGQAELIEARGARRREDPLLVATWRLDALGHADAALLVEAARIARYAQDFVAVERLARHAHEDEPTAFAALLLGEALYELAQFEESDTVLAAARSYPMDPATELLLASTRSKNLFWGLLEPDRALGVLIDARSRLSAVEATDELVAEEASIHTFSGRPVEALALLDDIRGQDDLRTRVVRAWILAPALTAVGRCGEAASVAERGFVDHLELGDQLAIAHPGSHIVAQAFALTDAGRLSEAEKLAQAGYDITVSDRSLIGQIWFTLNLGRVASLQGRTVTARRWYLEGVGLARATNFRGPLRLALAGLAMARALQGDREAARADIAEMDSLAPFAFLHAEQEMARAWVAVVEGDLAYAENVLAAAAADAAEHGAALSEAKVLHDLARLGGAGLVAARLSALAEEIDSDLIGAAARHGRALASGDAGELSGVAEDFEALGALVLAAEAATAAGEEWKRRGEQRRARAMAERAALLVAQCEGTRTPGLVAGDSLVPLSPREREVASLAADGLASKEIAERLFLSVRTVNNHLQRAYTKLGVTSRAELTESLARREV